MDIWGGDAGEAEGAGGLAEVAVGEEVGVWSRKRLWPHAISEGVWLIGKGVWVWYFLEEEDGCDGTCCAGLGAAVVGDRDGCAVVDVVEDEGGEWLFVLWGFVRGKDGLLGDAEPVGEVMGYGVF